MEITITNAATQTGEKKRINKIEAVQSVLEN